jgi:hypothetical protein
MSMLDWIANAVLAIVNYLPAQFVTQDSPNFTLVRAMFGLIFIVLVVLLIPAIRPLCAMLSRYLTKARH